MTAPFLATLNAYLNATSAIFLVAGYIFIRRKKILAHRISMILAFICSTIFLISYLMYHLKAGSVRFQGVGLIRHVYFSILISHTILAATVPFLAVIVLLRAFRRQFDRHKQLARIALPIWLYVSITGVVIYRMLYIVH